MLAVMIDVSNMSQKPLPSSAGTGARRSVGDSPEYLHQDPLTAEDGQYLTRAILAWARCRRTWSSSVNLMGRAGAILIVCAARLALSIRKRSQYQQIRCMQESENEREPELPEITGRCGTSKGKVVNLIVS